MIAATCDASTMRVILYRSPRIDLPKPPSDLLTPPCMNPGMIGAEFLRVAAIVNCRSVEIVLSVVVVHFRSSFSARRARPLGQRRGLTPPMGCNSWNQSAATSGEDMITPWPTRCDDGMKERYPYRDRTIAASEPPTKMIHRCRPSANSLP